MDRSRYSPALPSKIVYAGVTHLSFAQASENLLTVGDVVVSAKQVERVTQGIGLERCVERDDAVACYQALPLVQRQGVPDGVTPPPPVAVVGTDGGRIQILERAAAKAAAEASAVTDDASPPPSEVAAARGGRHWREDKIGLLMGMQSDLSATDPCGQIPEGFLEPTRMGKLVRELRKGGPPCGGTGGRGQGPGR